MFKEEKDLLLNENEKFKGKLKILFKQKASLE
jgi:hypothetical protein